MNDKLDFVVAGVKVLDTDFTQFKTENAIRNWLKAALKAYAEASGNADIFSESRQKVAEILFAKINPLIAEMRAASEERKKNTPSRNQNMIVRARNEGRDESMNYDIGELTAQNIFYRGFRMFTHAAQMTGYETDAYEMLGEDECDRRGIETLYDLFGTEWAQRFFAFKASLNAKLELADAIAEREALDLEIKRLRDIIAEAY